MAETDEKGMTIAEKTALVLLDKNEVAEKFGRKGLLISEEGADFIHTALTCVAVLESMGLLGGLALWIVRKRISRRVNRAVRKVE